MGAVARNKRSDGDGDPVDDRAAYLERTHGGAIPDPDDDTVPGRFARGLVSYEELQAFYRDDAGAEQIDPAALPETN
jgi:hypothetical protein